MSMLRIAHRPAGIVSALALFAAAAAAQATTRVSVNSLGQQAHGDSVNGVTSADGQVVAFVSYASNLAAGLAASVAGVYVHDRSTGVTERVSVDSNGNAANGQSWLGAISADGNLVVFQSYASNLVPGDTNGTWDVFLHDRTTGTTERVSLATSGVEGNGDSWTPVISARGRFVAFTSTASNLVAGDTNGCEDVFVRDRATGITKRVSVDSSGAQAWGNSDSPSISADGKVVAFASAADSLVPGDSNGVPDIFIHVTEDDSPLHGRAKETTERVNVDSSGGQANPACFGGYWGYYCYGSWAPAISGDGSTIAFTSYADNLVHGDRNGVTDVFVHDRGTGRTERVSVDSSGVESDNYSDLPTISSDGQIVAFQSYASNLVAGKAYSYASDAYVHDRITDITRIVSVDSAGAFGNGEAYQPVIAADGQTVAFYSYSSNLVAGDTNGNYDTFVHEMDWVYAKWENYGAGFPGTRGIPSFTSRYEPVIGQVVTLDLENSLGWYTPGLLFIGAQRATLHTAWGGDLLVLPTLTKIIALAPGGTTFTSNFPKDPNLIGVTLDVQAIELDPGAAKGVSFTDGLELVIGR